MEFNVADLFEAACDRIPEREILVCGERHVTFRELDRRANQMAHYFLSLGLGRGDHIAIYGENSIEWVEAMVACYKIRAVAININYRYVEDELRYLFDNADITAVVFQGDYTARLAAIRNDLPKLRHFIVYGANVEQARRELGAVEYEAALAGQSPERGFETRSGDDVYVLYTGGTTGMPKGVMWRQKDVMFALGGAIDAYTGEKAASPEAMIARIKDEGYMVQMPLAPLMHGAAQWAVLSQMIAGNRVVLYAGSFDAHRTLGLIEREKVTVIMITGDAVARPLADAMSERNYDLASLAVVASSAAIFSPSVKRQFFEKLPKLLIVDAVGASEQGMTGRTLITKDTLEQPQEAQRAFKIRPGPDVCVLDENYKKVSPGSQVVGRLARGGNVPFGYYKDPKKSAEVFVEAEGQRWSLAGDMATIEEDGSIVFLGRGSTSINSGGEKIYPEEVESALKSHPSVFDALVVGTPDTRWGERVTAVVQLRKNESATLEELSQHCRKFVAGYKVPRELHLVPEIKRAPSGKPNYPWAKETALSGQFKVN